MVLIKADDMLMTGLVLNCLMNAVLKSLEEQGYGSLGGLLETLIAGLGLSSLP